MLLKVMHFAFLSVIYLWCFFAAVLSGIIYWIVRMNSKKTIV